MTNQQKIVPVDFDPFAGDTIAHTAPSTESQKEIWSSIQMGPDANCAYNESISLKFKGDLNNSALTQAFLQLIKRHDALRTTFGSDGKTLCIAENPETIGIPNTDLSSLTKDSKEAKYAEIIKNAVDTPFSLETGPLFRLNLVTMDAREHILIITMHHIICDGWSMSVLVNELGKFYSGALKNENTELSNPYNFSAYALQQNSYTQSTQFSDTINYWYSHFKEIPVPIDLPTDNSRPLSRSFSSLRYDFIIPKELVSQLKKMSVSAKCSFFVSILAAFKVLLFRLTNQNDITVGIPAAGQSAVGHMNLVGHCVNLLPLRSTLSNDQSFLELLKNLKATMLDALDYQEFTFGTLLQKLAIKRDPSRVPLVPILFNVDQSIDESKLPFDGLTVEFISNPRLFENFELFINAMEHEGSLKVECQYNTDLFTLETIERWSFEFIEILTSIAKNPSEKVGQLNILPPSEKNKILIEYNNTFCKTTDYTTMHGAFEAMVTSCANSIAVQCSSQKLTYGQLDSKANKLANFLIAQGIKPTMLVGISLERTSTLVVALLGILKTGAAYVPLDPDYPSNRLSSMIEDAGLSFIVSDESVHPKLPANNATIISLDRDASFIQEQSSVKPATVVINPLSPAYVIFTSGSTGKPKGVIIPHKAVANFIMSMIVNPGISSKDILVAITTLSFDIAVLELFVPISAGATTVVADRETTLDGDKLGKLLDFYKATILQATPATYRMLLAAGWKGSPSLKVLCGGEAFPADLADALLARCESVWNMYGPTETTVWSTCFKVQSPHGPIFIGRPIANTTIYIVNELMQPVPTGAVGELCIGGAGVTLGYLNNEEQTSKNFVANPFENNGGLIYKTGDLARYHNSGNLECLGRIDTQVKIRGFRIELGEIETALGAHPDIRSVTVVKVEPHPGDVRLAAYFISHSGNKPDIAELKTHIRRTLPEHMIPQHFIYISDFPLTPSKKVDRKKLSLLPVSGDIHKENFVEPSTPTQIRVASLWKDVLGYEKIGVYDNFFDSGGHSLLVTQVISRIRKTFGLELSMRQFFELPTIAQQAIHFEAIQKIRNTHTSSAKLDDLHEEIEL